MGRGGGGYKDASGSKGFGGFRVKGFEGVGIRFQGL